jgi:hypothetical protein
VGVVILNSLLEVMDNKMFFGLKGKDIVCYGCYTICCWSQSIHTVKGQYNAI